MGLYSDYIAKNGANSGRTIPNIEWTLKTIDTNNDKSGGELDTKLAEINQKITDGLATKAPINATLTDATESSTLPPTTNSPITTILQIIRSNLKWLFGNKVNKSGDTMTGTLQGADKSGSWISTFTQNTAFYVPPNLRTGSTAQGVLSWRTALGDGYAIANLNNENKTRLISTSKANIDSGNNAMKDVCWFENGIMYVSTPPL